MPKSAKNSISRTVEWNEDLTAPIKKGQTVGYVNVYNGDENIGKIPITAGENIKKRDFMLSFCRIFNEIFKI